MENLFKRIESAINNGYGVVVTVGENVAEGSKEAAELARTKKDLEGSYYVLGVKAYDLLKNTPKLKAATTLAGEITEISELLEKEAALEKSLKNRFTAPTCENCGAKLGKDANFCATCGTQVPEEEDFEEVPSANVCTCCGEELEDGDNFCGNCGTPRFQ